MKKFSKLVVVILAAVMLMSVTVTAAGPGGAEFKNVIEGATLSWNTEDNFAVVYENDAIVDSGLYMIFFVEGEGAPIESNIYYLNQAPATNDENIKLEDGKVTFGNVWPKSLVSGHLLLTGTGLPAGGVKLGEIDVPYKLGDVNEDKKITIIDAAKLLQAIAGNETLTASQKKAADVNLDGKVTITDAAKLVSVIAGVEKL